MRPKRLERRTECPIETTLSVVGGLWKSLNLFALIEEKRRFGELSHLISKATPRVLTLHLRELEADGVISRTVFAEVPPRVEYALTELGVSLEPVLRSLHKWGEHRLALSAD